MKIAWVKGNAKISFNRPNVFMILGVRGSGKSSLLETIGTYYLQQEHKILDLFGSRDGENLAWLRSPFAEDKKILLIKGDNTDVDCSWEVKSASNVTLWDIENHDITISSSPLYSHPRIEFEAVGRITDLVYNRLSWKKIIYMIVREAANLYYSRLKVEQSQLMAKAQEIYLLRESRHMGVAVGLDTLKFTSVDIDVRAVTDFQIFKALGLMGLPKELSWIYAFIDPAVLRNMKPHQFIILSRNSDLGLGVFKAIPWHKEEKENILKELGIYVEHGEPIKEPIDRGKWHTVGDREHSQIIEAYVAGFNMTTLAKKFGRSSATIKSHIHLHDEAVEKNGFCPMCRRVKSPYAKIKVLRKSVS